MGVPARQARWYRGSPDSSSRGTNRDRREESDPMAYPRHGQKAGVPASPSLPELEQRVLDYWAEDQTFAASVDARAAGDNEYVFYDGPPFANGLPHYGHLLTGYV